MKKIKFSKYEINLGDLKNLYKKQENKENVNYILGKLKDELFKVIKQSYEKICPSELKWQFAMVFEWLQWFCFLKLEVIYHI